MAGSLKRILKATGLTGAKPKRKIPTITMAITAQRTARSSLRQSVRRRALGKKKTSDQTAPDSFLAASFARLTRLFR